MTVRLLALTFGLVLAAGGAWAGPLPGTADNDGDTVLDTFDNCTTLANAPQTDTDHNGCGDSCTQTITCDFNGDKAVGGSDFVILASNFGMTGVPLGTLGDCSPINGVVGSTDFLALSGQFGHTVGPSGITTAQCKVASCRCTPQ